MVRIFLVLCLSVVLTACQQSTSNDATPALNPQNLPETYLVVLGIAQDAGYPQAGCTNDCCQPVWNGTAEKRHATCLGLVDRQSGETWLFEASPAIREQLNMLAAHHELPNQLPTGILLTHAHMGHYTGLMHLGREAMGAHAVPVYAMPKMAAYLRKNGPWSQLVQLNNIALQRLQADSAILLNERIRVTPFLVPHRDEFSETVGFRITAPGSSALFIPDIDKWSKWGRDLKAVIAEVDHVIIDGTFYRNGELPNRDMSEVPHPFVEETMAMLADLPDAERQKVIFIHFNHTNPLLLDGAEAAACRGAGFRVAREGMVLPL